MAEAPESSCSLNSFSIDSSSKELRNTDGSEQHVCKTLRGIPPGQAKLQL